jgi:CDP-4-dehydro-6-deoxyglucose reductase, E1
MSAKANSWKKWKPGMKHLMNRIQWDEREMDSVQNLVLNKDWFGYGEANKSLEEKLAQFTKIPYFNLTNSGSSAIAVAVQHLKDAGRVHQGDLVLHPITTFPTSIAPAIREGLVPFYVETKPNTYVVDEAQVERAIERFPEIKGMILPHLLGNIPDMTRITAALGDRFLIEDSCDTMGGTYNGKHTGSFGDFVAFSFYGSHHITSAGVGGAVGTHSERRTQDLKSRIFWGHDYDTHTGNDSRKEFLARYNCQTVGNNFQMSAIQAAFALSQMDRLPQFVQRRKEQFQEMYKLLSRYEGSINLPQSNPKADPSWFSFPITVKEEASFTRDEFANYLTKNNVETRPIMLGNILRQRPYQLSPHSSLSTSHPVGDYISERGLFIPCWGMPNKQRESYYSTLERFFKEHKN